MSTVFFLQNQLNHNSISVSESFGKFNMISGLSHQAHSSLL